MNLNTVVDVRYHRGALKYDFRVLVFLWLGWTIQKRWRLVSTVPVKLALRTCISSASYLMETGFMGYAGMQMGKWEERYTATLLHATHDNNIIRFSFLI